MAAMRDVLATETAIIYGLEPVWGAGFAWFLLGERWGVSGWIGAALVLGTTPFFSFSPYIHFPLLVCSTTYSFLFVTLLLKFCY